MVLSSGLRNRFSNCSRLTKILFPALMVWTLLLTIFLIRFRDSIGRYNFWTSLMLKNKAFWYVATALVRERPATLIGVAVATGATVTFYLFVYTKGQENHWKGITVNYKKALCHPGAQIIYDDSTVLVWYQIYPANAVWRFWRIYYLKNKRKGDL